MSLRVYVMSILSLGPSSAHVMHIHHLHRTAPVAPWQPSCSAVNVLRTTYRHTHTLPTQAAQIGTIRQRPSDPPRNSPAPVRRPAVAVRTCHTFVATSSDDTTMDACSSGSGGGSDTGGTGGSSDSGGSRGSEGSEGFIIRPWLHVSPVGAAVSVSATFGTAAAHPTGAAPGSCGTLRLPAAVAVPTSEAAAAATSAPAGVAPATAAAPSATATTTFATAVATPAAHSCPASPISGCSMASGSCVSPFISAQQLLSATALTSQAHSPSDNSTPVSPAIPDAGHPTAVPPVPHRKLVAPFLKLSAPPASGPGTSGSVCRDRRSYLREEDAWILTQKADGVPLADVAAAVQRSERAVGERVRRLRAWFGISVPAAGVCVGPPPSVAVPLPAQC